MTARAGRAVRLLLLAGVAALSALSARAQEACPDELAAAQQLYVRGAFAEVEARLDPCVQPGRLREGDRVRAYRLLALTALQTGRIAEARRTVVSLLRLRPGYDADPALDPPSYTDLVGTVRRQLGLGAPPPRAAADTTRLAVRGRTASVRVPDRLRTDLAMRPIDMAPLGAGLRRSGAIELTYWGGLLHYAPNVEDDVLAGYFQNDAPRLGFQLAVPPARVLVVGVGAEAAYFPRFAGDAAGTADAFVVQATLDGRLRALPEARVSPYLAAGVSVIGTTVRGETSTAIAPTGGLGLDVWATDGLSVFVEATAALPSGDALATGDAQGVFTGARLGLRSYFRR